MSGFLVVRLEKHAQPTKFSTESTKIGLFCEADENDRDPALPDLHRRQHSRVSNGRTLFKKGSDDTNQSDLSVMKHIPLSHSPSGE